MSNLCKIKIIYTQIIDQQNRTEMTQEHFSLKINSNFFKQYFK